MSYILDALRKAERDRNLGDSPKLDFTPPPQTGSQRSWAYWLVIGGLGVCVGVLGAMQLSRYLDSDQHADTAAGKVTASVPATPEPPRVAEVPPVAPPPPIEAEALAPPPPAPTHRPVQVSTPRGPVEVDMPLEPDVKLAPVKPPPKPAPARTPKPAPAPPPSRSVAEPEVAAMPAPAEPMAEPAPSASFKVPSPAEIAAEMERTAESPGDVEELPPPSFTPDGLPASEPPPVEEAPLVSYLGLPPDIRNDIGELAMNAHVYSSTPGRGFVIINGRRYRPGDALQEGPVLDEIRQEGAVLAYRGRRFILPVPR